MNKNKPLSIFVILLGSLGISATLVYSSTIILSNFFPLSRNIYFPLLLFLIFGLLFLIGIRNLPKSITNTTKFTKNFLITYFLMIFWLITLQIIFVLFKNGSTIEFLMLAFFAIFFLFFYSLISAAISLAYTYSFKYTLLYNLLFVLVLTILGILEFYYILLSFPTALALQGLVPYLRERRK